jgi:hypothetical protein
MRIHDVDNSQRSLFDRLAVSFLLEQSSSAAS